MVTCNRSTHKGKRERVGGPYIIFEIIDSRAVRKELKPDNHDATGHQKNPPRFVRNKSFTRLSKMFSSLIQGFLPVLLSTKKYENIIAANMAKQRQPFANRMPVTERRRLFSFCWNISTNGSIRTPKYSPRMQKSFGMKTMMYESAGRATLPLTTKRMAH